VGVSSWFLTSIYLQRNGECSDESETRETIQASDRWEPATDLYQQKSRENQKCITMLQIAKCNKRLGYSARAESSMYAFVGFVACLFDP
jgi:hypothetical protein